MLEIIELLFIRSSWTCLQLTPLGFILYHVSKHFAMHIAPSSYRIREKCGDRMGQPKIEIYSKTNWPMLHAYLEYSTWQYQNVRFVYLWNQKIVFIRILLNVDILKAISRSVFVTFKMYPKLWRVFGLVKVVLECYVGLDYRRTIPNVVNKDKTMLLWVFLYYHFCWLVGCMYIGIHHGFM